MAWPGLQILVTAASVLYPLVVMAQREVIISVSYDRISSYFYHLGFSVSLFTQFHECLSNGTDNCMAVYGPQHCPECIVKNVTQSGQGDQELQDYYYKCSNDASKTALNCETTSPGTRTDSYLLRNSSHPSTCFGFVWTSGSENIALNSSQWNVEFCGANRACPSRSTTAQPGTTTTTTETTTTFSSPSPAESVSPIHVTSFPSSSSTSSVATQGTSPTKTPTEPTTAVSTATSGSPSTESLSGTDNSGDVPPIAVIVGAVVGVIAVIIITIIIVVICRRRRPGVKSSDNVAGVRGKRRDGKSHSYPNTEFFESTTESHTPINDVIKTNGNQNSVHQSSIPTDLPKPQFAIKDNDSDFGYSKAQLVVPEDNTTTRGNKTHDNYDYVYSEDDVGVLNPDPKSARKKMTVVSPPKVKEDYAVVEKTRKNKNSDNINANSGLTNDYNIIPEEDYGYSHAEGDPSPQDANKAAVGKTHVTVPTGTLPGTSDLNQDFGYEYARARDGYTTIGDGIHLNPSNVDSNAKNVYSRLYEPARDIQNPYDVGPNTNNVYSKLREEVRNIQNPYNVLPEPQVASDSNNALPDTAKI